MGSVAGDVRSWIEADGRTLYPYALMLTADPHEADDVVQAVLERLLRSSLGAKRVGDVGAYARRCVANEVADRGRARSRLQRLLNRLSSDPRAEGIGLSAADVVVQHAEIYDALQLLPLRQREAVVMRYYLDLDDEAIAASLQCRVGTVRSLLSRGRHQLRQHLRM